MAGEKDVALEMVVSDLMLQGLARLAVADDDEPDVGNVSDDRRSARA